MPELRHSSDRLLVFIDKGKLRCTAAASLSWEYGYELQGCARSGVDLGQPHLGAAFSRQIAKLTQQLVGTKDAFARQLLTAELRNLCSLVDRPMPDPALLGKDHQQLPLEV